MHEYYTYPVTPNYKEVVNGFMEKLREHFWLFTFKEPKMQSGNGYDALRVHATIDFDGMDTFNIVTIVPMELIETDGLYRVESSLRQEVAYRLVPSIEV